MLVGIDVFFSFLMPADGIAHVAHVGGALFGYLFFRLQGLSRRAPHPPPRAVERVVMVQSGAAEPERRTPVTPARPRRRADADPVAAEVDRVLDKISEKGIAQPHARGAALSGRGLEAEEAGELLRRKLGASGSVDRFDTTQLSVHLGCRYRPSPACPPFPICPVLINLLPDFLAVLDAADRECRLPTYRDNHRPILDAYWRNYVLDPDSPHADEIVSSALHADRSDLLEAAASVDLERLADEAIARGRMRSCRSTGRPTSI